MAAGNLMGRGSIAQDLQKQVGQTGIPAYDVSNACATALRTAIMAVKAGEVEMGLAVGVEKLAGAGLLAGGRRPDDAGRVRPDRHEYGHKYGGVTFELFAKISEKNHSHSTLNPLAAYNKAMTLEQIMNDVMIANPNTRPMCSANCDGAAAAVVTNGEKLKTLSLEQQRRAIKVTASILTTDPWEEACQVLPTSTRSPATRRTRCTSRPCRAIRPRPGRAARLLRHCRNSCRTST